MPSLQPLSSLGLCHTPKKANFRWSHDNGVFEMASKYDLKETIPLGSVKDVSALKTLIEEQNRIIYFMSKTQEVFAQSSEPEAHVENGRQTKNTKQDKM